MGKAVKKARTIKETGSGSGSGYQKELQDGEQQLTRRLDLLARFRRKMQGKPESEEEEETTP